MESEKPTYSEKNVVMRGKGERSEFFIFVSTLPWDKSGVFPGLFDRLTNVFFFSTVWGEPTFFSTMWGERIR